MKKDLITIKDLTPDEIFDIFALAKKLKAKKIISDCLLEGKSLGLIFQKPSNRTRVSFEVGMTQLGGHAIYLGPEDIKLGKREAIKDVARTLSRYLDGLVARTYLHQDVLELAKYATIPVINGLSDVAHPCQALSDVFTIEEKIGKLKGANLVFIGDGNNVLNSLLYCCAKVGVNIAIATPKGYEPETEMFGGAMSAAKKSGSKITLTNDPREILKDADIVYTDVWVSMGQESEHDKRLKAFTGFQVNDKLLSNVKKSEYFVMHCLPAHRDEEITDSVLDGKQSIVFDQAENRLHVQKAILLTLLKQAR